MTSIVLCYTVACIMAVIGVMFYTGKAASYIEGYSNMPEEEKRNINIIPLCKNISVMFFLAAAIFAIAGYVEVFRLDYFKWVMIGWIALCCADVVYINKSGRYGVQPKSDHKKEPRKMRNN